MLEYNLFETYQIHIQGLVQGVGFRPYIYRQAHKFQLKGWVENSNDGVFIRVNIDPVKLGEFLSAIKNEAPTASDIFRINYQKIVTEEFSGFEIIKSRNKSDEITEVSPDIGVCSDCLADLKTQTHRINYPFINCTNCGPRFTIIKDLPYDREKTSMNPFVMCDQCRSEYMDVLDRRFHAQPVACKHCGPQYQLYLNGEIINDFNQIISNVCELLEKGDIVAIKGLGGYHLACDAQNEEAVQKLRNAKNRDGKPFAVMFRDISSLKKFTECDPVEEKLLTSWRNPILLLKDKNKLAPSVSVGFKTTGAMLPYMPFHYLLFQQLKLPVIVLTSGNITDEPIIIDNQDALEILGSIASAVLTYNRDIYNRTDDSVAFVSNNKSRLIRRSRSYVPSPVRLSFNAEGIFAAGAELVNCFCIGKSDQAILSQHIGDLKNLETLEFYSESVARFQQLFRFKPTLVVHDLHPDYLSTKYAKGLNLTHIGVQHHHAHIASCMAEHQLDEKVIGIAFDGVGLGDDGNIWGSEFLICDFEDYKRYSHFEFVPMPGGDNATKNPWRMAVSYLYKYYGKSFLDLNLTFLKKIPDFEVDLIIKMLDKNINCPLTSSAGRLFDAVAALTDICTQSSFHAEAPMRLEAAIDKKTSTAYDFEIGTPIKLENIIKGIVEDLQNGINKEVISAKFHNTIINIIFEVANKIRQTEGLNKVVLSGGSFQNRFLLERVENLLSDDGFEVFAQENIPANDGGLALGQLAIAAKRRALKLINVE
ncbi:MAG: carbamoyltransferase HypF [Bacteroidetes bacterium]|nr:carbamoyltransferase HypF [Bacteroidota bacterium]